MISFIIPLFNHVAASIKLLDSLLQTIPSDIEYEIILADDGSTDDTKNWLANLSGDNILKISRNHNSGYGEINNIAIMQSKGDLLALLNNDLVLELGWLQPMVNALRGSWRNVGIVGNIQLDIRSGSVDHSGFMFNDMGDLIHRREMPPSSKKTLQTIAVTGACMLLERSTFDTIGGFDKSYFNGCEDIDLCFKTRAIKKNIILCTESVIHHHVSLSRGKENIINEKNSQILFKKWRHQIKQDLSDHWLLRLQSGVVGTVAPNYLVNADVLASPHLASRRIAEALLQRKERHWATVFKEEHHQQVS